MNFGGINYLAVVLAAFAGFATGMVWYMIFGKPWMKAVGLSEADAGAKPFLFANAIVCLLVMAWVLAGLVGHLGEGQTTVRNGVVSGLFVWGGFVLTTQLVNHRFARKPWALSFIDCGHWLAVLLVEGAVIGFMGV